MIGGSSTDDTGVALSGPLAVAVVSGTPATVLSELARSVIVSEVLAVGGRVSWLGCGSGSG
ncbi:hypothetical protein, partial [Nocardia noduli]|uniref:hypothetical protein n=1 Tax=Nocardia noduli TaxID=2815722 RepID=UPI001C2152E8